ncbi:hypothetical protein [Clostridium sp. JS66]|uniref:hypothetical protein n=1 Tax=Clostridium sp. JS66 TaxID=3064705 RepID=UPI00298DEB7D|nr:hypothetical protein [Clostridium sp. JS66]WPC44856.1 hypothetical protein Q6H37_01630 [Clostridium sp. JS66]
MEVLNILSSFGLLVNYFTIAKDVVLDMLNTFIKCVSIVYVIKLVLKHNLFIYHLKIKIKFLGLDIEVKSKEKSAPSSQD